MLSGFLFCCFLVVASSDGAVITKERNVAAVTDWLHKISKRHSSQLEIRQDNTACENQLQSNYPSYCNFTELSGGLSDLPPSSLTDAQLTTLNNAYSRLCVSACIDPIETYVNCLQEDDKDFFITYIHQGVCGQESGDYCEVRYIREYEGNYSSFQSLFTSCPYSGSGGISCSSASSTCLSYVNTFSDRMGCCTEPYLGSGVNSCSGVSVDEPCNGVSTRASTGVLTATIVSTIVSTGEFTAVPTANVVPTGASTGASTGVLTATIVSTGASTGASTGVLTATIVSTGTSTVVPTATAVPTGVSSATGLVAPVFMMILSLVVGFSSR